MGSCRRHVLVLAILRTPSTRATAQPQYSLPVAFTTTQAPPQYHLPPAHQQIPSHYLITQHSLTLHPSQWYHNLLPLTTLLAHSHTCLSSMTIMTSVAIHYINPHHITTTTTTATTTTTTTPLSVHTTASTAQHFNSAT